MATINFKYFQTNTNSEFTITFLSCKYFPLLYFKYCSNYLFQKHIQIYIRRRSLIRPKWSFDLILEPTNMMMVYVSCLQFICHYYLFALYSIVLFDCMVLKYINNYKLKLPMKGPMLWRIRQMCPIMKHLILIRFKCLCQVEKTIHLSAFL